MSPIGTANLSDLSKQRAASTLEKTTTKKPQSEAEVKKVAEEFEAIFVGQMLETMREGLDNEGLLPVSNGEKIFRSMLDQEYAKTAAKTGSFGLRDMIYQQLKGQSHSTSNGFHKKV